MRRLLVLVGLVFSLGVPALARTADAKVIAVPPVTITSLAHRTLTLPLSGIQYSDGVDFPCGSGGGTCTSSGFSAAIAPGDTIQARFQAPPGQRFSVTRGPYATAGFFVEAEWIASSDTLSTASAPSVVFENLSGVAPVVAYESTAVGNAGAWFQVQWVGSTSGDFTFTAVTLSFTAINSPPGVTLTFPPVTSIASLSFFAGVSGPTGSPDSVTMRLEPVGPACSNGVDDDGDGLIDYPNDPGCRNATSASESPQCQDGIDNDLDGKIDFDGGASANHGVALAAPDPNCGAAWHNSEKPVTGCGVGAELAIVMPLLAYVASRRRRAN